MMPYKLDFSVVVEKAPELLLGAAGTLGLAAAGMTIALLIGIPGVAARRSQHGLLRRVVAVFVEVIRNTPFLVQIYFIFFALPLAGLRLNPTLTAVVALGINGGAYSIEIIRGGLDSIHRGQWEAGLALGLHRGAIFRLIVLKPALRAIYPALVSQFVLLTLTTSVCTSIAAYELTSVAQVIESDTFRSFEVYFTITGMYLVIAWLAMTGLGVAGRRYFDYPVG
jgi:polar amino acid transport system permease protein